MKWLMPLLALGLVAGCKTSADADALSLSFAAYKSTPVVVTHFSIEMPLAPTPKFIPGGIADQGPPRSAGAALGDVPGDAGGDGLWRVAARWVELTTDRAWQAELDVPFDQLTVNYSQYALNVIMGPNGLLLIGSDNAGIEQSDLKDVARICGNRVPSDDKAWRLEAGDFPELPIILGDPLPPATDTECPSPQD